VFGFEVALRPGQKRTLTLALRTPGAHRGKAVVVDQPLATAAPPAEVALARCAPAHP
jgi:hypothetical protein